MKFQLSSSRERCLRFSSSSSMCSRNILNTTRSERERPRSKDDRQLVIIPADNVPAYLIREQDNKEAYTRHLMGARWRRMLAICPCRRQTKNLDTFGEAEVAAILGHAVTAWKWNPSWSFDKNKQLTSSRIENISREHAVEGKKRRVHWEIQLTFYSGNNK